MGNKSLLILLAALPLSLPAQNWDYITTSGEYYYGVGCGTDVAEASETAMAELVGMIATYVSKEFVGLFKETNHNGEVSHEEQVLNCVKTYSTSTLTNVEKWVVGKEPNICVRRYIKRTELERIYADRIEKAKDMVLIADEALQKRRIDMALQYYYWAYSLIRSVQRPNEVKDAEGRVLMNWLPIRIDDVLSKVNVAFEKRDGDYVDLLFSYEGQPVSQLEYTYSDGRADCQGAAKDGRGILEMAPGYETDIYHLSLSYEYKGQARGDAEMQSVLDVITPKVFSSAEVKVKALTPDVQKDNDTAVATQPTEQTAMTAADTGLNLKPSEGQLVTVDVAERCADIMTKITEAIQKRRYSDVSSCFTLEGLDMYNKLISYGTGRIVGSTEIQFFKGLEGHTVARGLQMAFTMHGNIKKTFVEDVVFSINSDGKIDNVAFGLGQTTENDILCKYAPGWKDETRELIMEFLENYKTAYCLKRIDYIRNIFADDAVIIIGNVVRRNTAQSTYEERPISLQGQDIIKYNRYSKNEYLRNLQRCFNRNEFINIRFTNNEVQLLEKFEPQEKYAIQIGQEYDSTTYSDKGYLFLLVDMTDHHQPQIKIRTWQPNEVAMEKLYNAGDFYNE